MGPILSRFWDVFLQVSLLSMCCLDTVRLHGIPSHNTPGLDYACIVLLLDIVFTILLLGMLCTASCLRSLLFAC